MDFQTRKIAFAICLLGLACFASGDTHVQAQSTAPRASAPEDRGEQKARELLGSMIRAERSTAYTATEIVQHGHQPAESSHIWRSGRKLRREWVQPPMRHGDLLIDDGSDVWVFNRQENSATQTKSVPLHGDNRLAKMKANFSARVARTAFVGDRRAVEIEITARTGRGPVRRLWIDSANDIVLRRERVGANGRVQDSSELRNVHFGAVAPSRFVWSPPPGIQQTKTSGRLFLQLPAARRAAPWLQIPRTLGANYAFENAVIDSAGGEAHRGQSWLRYSTGTHRISIFQERVNSSETKPPITVAGGLYWERGGSRFLAAGLPPRLALQIANGVN